jgi:Fur family transcriptional regulator, ferric uptake regulator
MLGSGRNKDFAMDTEKRLQKVLSRRNLRMTTERQEILEAVSRMQNHFTVSDLIRQLKSNGGTAGRSTVYRAIPHLIEAKIIRRASMSCSKEEQRYEGINSLHHHDHLTCEMCGEIVEFEDKEIERLQRQVAQKYGYRLTRHFLELRGICKKCQDKIIEEAVGV